MTLREAALKNRNLVQLTTLLTLFCVYPMVQDLALGRVLLEVMFTAILLAGVFSLSVRPRYYRPAVVLSVTALVFNWSSRSLNPETQPIGILLTGVFFAYILTASFLNLITGRSVSRETVFQALNIYLFIGMFFATVFALLELWSPGSLRIPSTVSITNTNDWFSMTFYFSFVNLTTVGFGDMTR